jgi:hypothetical protein
MRRLLLALCLLGLPALADAKTMYTRNLDACANNGDGTAYACAASGGAVGAYRGLGNVAWGAWCIDVRGYACRPDRHNLGAYQSCCGDQAATRSALTQARLRNINE